MLINKMLSYRRETALQGTLVLAKSGRTFFARCYGWGATSDYWL